MVELTHADGPVVVELDLVGVGGRLLDGHAFLVRGEHDGRRRILVIDVGEVDGRKEERRRWG